MKQLKIGGTMRILHLFVSSYVKYAKHIQLQCICVRIKGHNGALMYCLKYKLIVFKERLDNYTNTYIL